MKKLIPLITPLLFIFIAPELPAQTPSSMETPKWVTMMEDPNVNFYEAVKEYESFWSTREKPKKEAEIFDALNGKGRESGKSLEEMEADRLAKLGPKMEGRALEEMEYLKYQSKRFDKWVLEVKPWVQADGHILTYEERQAIWNKQQEEIRQQENKK
jgi:hypothetical protein